MSTVATPARPSIWEQVRPFAMSHKVWCLLALTFIIARALGSSELAQSLGDTDDAMRLVQLRDWLAGASWYDLTLHRVGGSATPLVSHWSRLIDLPLAILLGAFSLILSPANAELAMRIVWPTLLLYLLLRLLVREAGARGGETAVIMLLIFSVTCLSGLFQFRPGRIDHHNAMILGTVGGLLMLTRAFETPRLGWPAGGLVGFALAVGYEPLALIFPMVGIAALSAVVNTTWLLPVRNFLIAMAATLAVSFVLAVPPIRWSSVVCDAISINMVLLSGVGAAGITILHAKGLAWSLSQRIVTLAAIGAAAVSFYVAADPVCLGGPFALVNADAKRVWLDTVLETQNIVATYGNYPTTMLVFLVFVAAGLAAAISRWRNDRSLEAAALLILMGFSILPALWQMKFMPYASWIAVLCLALRVSTFTGGDQLTPLSMRLIGAMSVNQSSLSLALGAALLTVGAPKSVVDGKLTADLDACLSTPAIVSLAKLPAGLVAGRLELGPYIVALTPHSVLSAPYHRIDAAIVEGYGILAAKPVEAEARLRKIGATYLADCVAPIAPGKTPELDKRGDRESLLGKLTFGEAVPFLSEIPNVSPVPALRVWQVLPPR
jgi:hypothetical protein